MAVQDIAKLATSVLGIYSCYLAYGIYQEKLYRHQDDGTSFSATAFVLGIQCCTNALVAAIGHLLVSTVFASAGPVKAPAVGGSLLTALPTRAVLLTSFVYVLAMYTSNEALAFVSYPTQALVKSCKMIPVMFGSILITGKSYPLLKWICVLLMTIGITMFQFGGKQKAHSSQDPPVGSEWIGLTLLTGSLCLDGITGPLQERMSVFNLSNMQQMLANNIWATTLMAVIAMSLGQWHSSIAYLAAHPILIKDLILFSLTSAFGQIFIFWTIRTFSSLTLSTITTTRKFFTIVMSVFYFGHPLATQQWLAVAVVFVGLSLEMLGGKAPKEGHGSHSNHPGATVASTVQAAVASVVDGPLSSSKGKKLHEK